MKKSKGQPAVWITPSDSRTCSSKADLRAARRMLREAVFLRKSGAKITDQDVAEARRAVADATGFLPNLVVTSPEVCIDYLLKIRDDYARALRKIKRMGGYAGRVAEEALK